MNRSRFTRWAAPVAFLAVITIGALVIRAGFQNGKHPHPRPQTTTVASKTKKKTQGHHAKRQGQKTYTIVSGDTLGTIATKTGTTVARLMQLNPGIDPNALRVGQTIRVQ